MVAARELVFIAGTAVAVELATGGPVGMELEGGGPAEAEEEEATRAALQRVAAEAHGLCGAQLAGVVQQALMAAHRAR